MTAVNIRIYVRMSGLTLSQRLQLATWPDDIGSWGWIDRTPNAAAKAKYYDVFNQLHALNSSSQPAEPLQFRFTPDAQLHFIDWITEIQSTARAHESCSAFESHLLKMPKTIAGLALLFELADGGRDDVGELATIRAIEWSDYLISHAKRLYNSAISQGLDGAHLILKRKNKLSDMFTARDILRKGWAGLDTTEMIAEALDYLVDYGHLTPLSVPINNVIGGRPTVHYIWRKPTVL